MVATAAMKIGITPPTVKTIEKEAKVMITAEKDMMTAEKDMMTVEKDLARTRTKEAKILVEVILEGRLLQARATAARHLADMAESQ